MAPGSVIVDLAAERGGNCELTKADETVVENGVTILGPTNLPSEVPHARQPDVRQEPDERSCSCSRKNGELDIESRGRSRSARRSPRKDGEVQTRGCARCWASAPLALPPPAARPIDHLRQQIARSANPHPELLITPP